LPELTDATASPEPTKTTGAIEALLPAIFDTVADGVTVLDRSWTVRFANEAAARLMGAASVGDLIGRSSSSLTDLFELLKEDGSPFDLSGLPTRRAFAGEADPEEIIRFRSRGTTADRWSLVRARLLPGATEADDLVVTSFQDITQIKRVELRLSFLSEASALLGEATDLTDALRRVAWMAVPFIADWFAIDLIEDSKEVHRVALAHGDPSMERIAEEAQQRWPPQSSAHGPVGEVTRLGRSLHVTDITDQMLQSVARDKDHLAILRASALAEAAVVPLIGRGQILGAFTAVNVGDRLRWTADDLAMLDELGRRIGAAVDAARLMLEAQDSVRVRDEFMAIASHDMRTPLAAIKGYAQLARRHLANAANDASSLDRWLADIDESAGRLTGLVSEFMDISLLRGGQSVPLQLQPVNLVDLVTEHVREHEGTDERTHQFSTTTTAEEIIGMWDPGRLGRVLDNLLSNAVKFSPKGGAIEVRVWADDGLGCVAVVDHGIGVAFRDQTLIFGPMFRASNAKGVAGTGLGLAGSRSLLDLMGGTISVESRIGEGSTFTIRLPLVGGAADPDEA
jgi:PAS domain S-box-containing protein